MASLKRHFDMLARYNAWANTRLYDAARELGGDDYDADHGAFFKSVKGTLNHLLVTDRIWRLRFEQQPAPDYRLDQILFDELAALRAARDEEDALIVGLAGRLTDDDLDGTLSYRRTTTQEQVRQPRAEALAHWFNHQAHHRGQAHALLTRIAGAAPDLDLLYYQRSSRPAPGTA